MRNKRFTIVGGGPVGALLAITLARHGYTVGLYEGRPDSRTTNIYQGRSINIALSDRGWSSLAAIGVSAEAKAQAVPMHHRAIHALDGELSQIAYGRDDQSIWSVSRGGINQQLLCTAEQEAGVTTHFEHRLVDVDFDTATTRFVTPGGDTVEVEADYVFAADGANSKVRRLAQERPRFSYNVEYMPESYIELNIPCHDDGSFRLEKNALHIWPRGKFMLIALPNPNGSFTCTLFLNQSGDVSFDALKTAEQVGDFFVANFADAMPHLEAPVETFLARRPAPLYLVQVRPWSFNNTVALIGDAAHAIVPYYGQGMNCGFEDCAALHHLIEEFDHDWEQIFPAYEAARRPNGDAIAELAKRNFVEMSDLSGDPQFQLRKQIEALFSERYPDVWTPLYSLVTFRPDIPYAEALRLGDIQDSIMNEVMALPDIENQWREPAVFSYLHQLATARLIDA
ncbi:MAG: NAD(P)/FAD-dependent oxidoreductase [Pseudomonadota bacterium]